MHGRKTHDYPNGKPLPITLSEVAFGVVGLFWILRPITWLRVGVFGALFIAFVFLRSKLLHKYEQMGRAVPRPQRKRIVFPRGMPAPLRVLRYAFFVPVIAVFAFGMAPLATARTGILASILTLVVMALVYNGLQAFYVKAGRAQEVSDEPDQSFDKKPS